MPREEPRSDCHALEAGLPRGQVQGHLQGLIAIQKNHCIICKIRAEKLLINVLEIIKSL